MKITFLPSHLGDRRSRTAALIFAGALAVICLTSSPVRAGIEPTPFQDWSDAFLLRATAPATDTLVRFGFNPQSVSADLLLGVYPPDPVMPSTAPTIIIDVPDGTDPLTGFEILFAMDTALTVSAPGEPNGDFAFQLLGAGGEVAFDVLLNITTSSGGVAVPGSWTSFNPQPEPPAFADGAAAVGFAFQLSSFSQATVTLQITDSQDTLLSFIDVPEPTTLALLTLGPAGLGFSNRRGAA